MNKYIGLAKTLSNKEELQRGYMTLGRLHLSEIATLHSYTNKFKIWLVLAVTFITCLLMKMCETPTYSLMCCICLVDSGRIVIGIGGRIPYKPNYESKSSINQCFLADVF